MIDIVDILGAVIKPGDIVTAAFREQNIAVLRVGEVKDVGVDYEPNVIRQATTPKVAVVWVLWDTSTSGYLPTRPTKIAARKALKVNDD